MLGSRGLPRKGRAFSKGVGHHLLLPVSGRSCPVMATGRCVTEYADIVNSTRDETQGLLEVTFVAILVPAGSICLFVCSFLSYLWTP